MLEHQALLANTLPKIKKEPIDLTGETLQPPTTRTNPSSSPFEAAPKGAQLKQLPLDYTHRHYKSHFEASMQAPNPSVSSNKPSSNTEARNPSLDLETPAGDGTNKNLSAKSNQQWLFRNELHTADVSTSSPSNSASADSSASTSGFLAEEITLDDMFGETDTRSADLSMPPDEASDGFSGGSADEVTREEFEGEVGREEGLFDAVKEKVVEGVEAVKGFF